MHPSLGFPASPKPQGGITGLASGYQWQNMFAYVVAAFLLATGKEITHYEL